MHLNLLKILLKRPVNLASKLFPILAKGAGQNYFKQEKD